MILYADDTSTFLSFSAVEYSNNVTHHENNVYNWMSSNFLSLNPSKIEFLVIDIPQHLAKLRNLSTHL